MYIAPREISTFLFLFQVKPRQHKTALYNSSRCSLLFLVEAYKHEYMFWKTLVNKVHPPELDMEVSLPLEESMKCYIVNSSYWYYSRIPVYHWYSISSPESIDPDLPRFCWWNEPKQLTMEAPFANKRDY